MPGLSDHERKALEAIERDLAAHDVRLVRRLAHPGRFDRWRWGGNRQWLIAALALLALSVIPLVVALIQ